MCSQMISRKEVYMKKAIYGVMAMLMPLGLCFQTTLAEAGVAIRPTGKQQLKILDQNIRQKAVAGLRKAATEELLRLLASREARETRKLQEHVRKLVEAGADVNAHDRNGNSVFSLAIWSGDADTVKFLMRKGARPDAEHCPGLAENYLMALAQKGYCLNGQFVFRHPGFKSDIELAKFFRGLSEAAAQPNMLALAEAIDMDNIPLAKYYIDWFGVNITRKADKRTALHELALQNNLDGVKFLLENGANPAAKDAEGKTPADLTTDAQVRSLLNYMQQDWKMDFPLHRAVRKDDIKTAVDLIYAGADVNEQLASDGRTPLIEAARFNHKNSVLLLIANGADLNKGSFKGDTPLHFTILQGSFSMIKLLVEKGADVNAVNADGNTPLHYAVRYGNERMVQYLKKNGARMDIKNKEGLSPAQIEAKKALERNQAYTQQVKWNLRYE